MKISLSGAGKRFNREWIFKKVNLELTSGNAYAITGPNGSGKSTLLQSIGCMLQLSEGDISFTNHDQPIALEEAYQHLSFCAPYLDVVEELTLVEFLQFHNQFKQFLPGMTIPAVIDLVGLGAAAQKQIRYYSSGMKQRVKLAQAILSDTGAVLLDEPCSNLDVKGIELYHTLVEEFCRHRLLIVCSNDEVEYRFCDERIAITDYKAG